VDLYFKKNKKGIGIFYGLASKAIVICSWISCILLSAIYISGVFILPRVIPESIQSNIWNPYSLLNIPIYGVLMILLILSLCPDLANPKMLSPIFRSLLLPGGIASVVGILDEVHQSYIPNREASVTDVVFDIIGVILVGIFIHIYRKRGQK
jgi:hypothetical protein